MVGGVATLSLQPSPAGPSPPRNLLSSLPPRSLLARVCRVVPQVIAAKHCGMRVLGLSLITNKVRRRYHTLPLMPLLMPS